MAPKASVAPKREARPPQRHEQQSAADRKDREAAKLSREVDKLLSREKAVRKDIKNTSDLLTRVKKPVSVHREIDGAGVEWIKDGLKWWWVAENGTWQPDHTKQWTPPKAGGAAIINKWETHISLAAIINEREVDVSDVVSESAASSVSTAVTAPTLTRPKAVEKVSAASPTPLPAATPAPALPASSGPEGLDSILSAAKVNPEDREKIMAWCQEEDAKEISEVLEFLDDIEASCGLRKLTRSRLEKGLTAACAGAS